MGIENVALNWLRHNYSWSGLIAKSLGAFKMSTIIAFSFFDLGAKWAVDGGGQVETEIQVSGQVTVAFLIG
jgi:hypothetical protein